VRLLRSPQRPPPWLVRNIEFRRFSPEPDEDGRMEALRQAGESGSSFGQSARVTA
jgi:hypothetical protein